MKLSEMRQILAEEKLRLTKSLGQNFLHDENQLRRIVDLAELSANDKVLEIGPGLGPLTDLLVGRAGEVLAIEKDRRLVEILKRRSASWKNFTLIHHDALKFLKTSTRDWTDWKLVSNLPYSVGSPILVELALDPKGPERMVATLQSDVAERLQAGPGGKDYGVLTLLVQLNYEPLQVIKVPASCFFPEPDVASACISLVRRSGPLLSGEETEMFVKVVKRAFSQRRKMMIKLLKQDWPESQLIDAFEKTKLSKQVRAETVSLRQYAEITRLLCLLRDSRNELENSAK